MCYKCKRYKRGKEKDRNSKHPHLATETVLVHVSYLVELSGWCHVHSRFHRFTDSRVELYDILGSIQLSQ